MIDSSFVSKMSERIKDCYDFTYLTGPRTIMVRDETSLIEQTELEVGIFPFAYWHSSLYR